MSVSVCISEVGGWLGVGGCWGGGGGMGESDVC